MSNTRPNADVSYSAERMFAFGAGVALTALVLGDGEDVKDSIAVLVGAVLVLSSMITSILIKRRQIKSSRNDNLTSLKK